MIDPASLVPSSQDTPLEPFAETSRYRGLPLLTYRDAAGREVVYVARRWIPPPEVFADVARYQVREGDRLDNIAAAHLGDPELYWRIADANRALAPSELTERIGRWLRLTLPAGFPGPRTR
ncbi:LysM peptidoglycan-binding domain-containing protein [Azotobacter chroococcum]|uniref:LysM peptidoglycan-binding domain-containing protein n=1 Tax=Azotobacter chroococcum TaxID=353 RepID=UPI0010AE6AF0|nr:LysM domain-containing protein [Azotobacter chroococcum]TKD47382.1 LysM peptidoglycan-binding domain-containing protein [Azotobacter chroococcum]